MSPIIFGCQGLELTADEIAFFKDARPFGFILFKRNCQSPDQVKKLTDQMRNLWDEHKIPILIDQEGGRVARLSSPTWTKFASCGEIGAMWSKNREAAKQAAYDHAFAIGTELVKLGINMNCAPMCDIRYLDSDSVIGDRAYGDTEESVTVLALEAIEGFLESGVTPIIKHIPGHGRARVDSHKALPVVDASLDELRKTDFVPFKTFAEMPYAMTAHVVYSAIDPDWPATLSERVIKDIIQTEIGFGGILMTDDISMGAIKGEWKDIIPRAYQAGCDLVLHCNGNMDEMREIIKYCRVSAD
jgi:beta-N-acetylhexosaminidase